MLNGIRACLIGTALVIASTPTLHAATIRLVRSKHDPYGMPRPDYGQKDVPLRTSLFLKLEIQDGQPGDEVLPNSVGVYLKPERKDEIAVLSPGRTFSEGYSGRLFSGKWKRGVGLNVYIDSDTRLLPSTQYAVRVTAKSREGAELSPRNGTWRFTTAAEPASLPVSFELSLNAKPVHWHGAFFSGFCKPSFCTSQTYLMETYKLMDQVREWAPRAWSLQRDFTLTGMDLRPSLLSGSLPNVVREQETRRISAIEAKDEGMLLHVEDFYGHEQYGIGSGRPLTGDYHPGDEILVADSAHDARAKVVSVDDRAKTVLVSQFDTPKDGWRLEIVEPRTNLDESAIPGRFALGGCYLRKFKPVGTPKYYWGRVDNEWDIAHRRFKRRLTPNFAEAPGDVSLDGRNFTTAKDYAELHQVVRAITSHLIERYGDDCLDFTWSVFNEPDLGTSFWRADWDELQKFYDYTVDGVLRAFEDHGYDSDRVFIGGLELGGIFGTHLRLQEFLAHCSPRAEAKGALSLNAAFADQRLNGKRSRRVEALCSPNDGHGSPCDFISVHAYNGSKMMAAKLAAAKQEALEIDPEYYEHLWINSFESCPDWTSPPDPAYGDSYLGNGYFPTWCADVARRQLQRATEDSRYASGETILTFWPWNNSNFTGGNAGARDISVDDDGDGVRDRTVTVAMPILNFLGLLSTMGPDYMVLPAREEGGHVVSGFVSKGEGEVRLLLYSHDELDTQSRSETNFQVTVNLIGLDGEEWQVREYRFDKDDNSYFRLGRQLRDNPPLASHGSATETEKILDAALRDLDSGERQTIINALDTLLRLGPKAAPALLPALAAINDSTDTEIKQKGKVLLSRYKGGRAYPADLVRQVAELSKLQETGTSEVRVNSNGQLRVAATVAANGANFLVIERKNR